MANCFNLGKKEFNDNKSALSILEIQEKQIVGKNHQDLKNLLKKQVSKLVLVDHPDKCRDEYVLKLFEIMTAYQEGTNYIKHLESGNSCVKNIHQKDDYCLTAFEFRYRRKLFEKCGINAKDVLGKNFNEITSVLKSKNKEFEEYLEIGKSFDKAKKGIFPCNIELKELDKKLEERSATPIAHLYLYVSPPLTNLKYHSRIQRDKIMLASEFIKHKNFLYSKQYLSSIILSILINITISCYLSLWIIPFSIITIFNIKLSLTHLMEKYKNSEISTDEFTNKINYTNLYVKVLILYPLAAFSVYLLSTNLIINGSTTNLVILGPMLALAIVAEALSSTFFKGSTIYTEKHVENLLTEDFNDKVEKETDLLQRYDLGKLLMPIMMPFIKICFRKENSELAERDFNFDGVGTKFSNVDTNQFSKNIPIIQK